MFDNTYAMGQPVAAQCFGVERRSAREAGSEDVERGAGYEAGDEAGDELRETREEGKPGPRSQQFDDHDYRACSITF